MLTRLRIALILLLFSSLLFAAPLCPTHSLKGKRLNKADILELIAQGQTGQVLNLCGTDLNGLDLSGLDLHGINFATSDMHNANLQEANLENANLRKTYLRWANLSKAKFFQAQLQNTILQNTNASDTDFRQTDLTDANFTQANLQNANLSGSILNNTNFNYSNLTNASLTWISAEKTKFRSANLTNVNFEHAKSNNVDFTLANLTNVDFSKANLSVANLSNAQLQNANFFQANLDRVLYQPQLNSMPNIIMLATAKNFRTLKFDRQLGSATLAELRNAYNQINMRPMERKITAILKSKEMRSAWQRGGWGYLESTANYFLFYLTSDFGAHPGRALKIFVWLIFLFAIPYFFTIRSPDGRNRIIISWYAQQLHQREHSYSYSNKKQVHCVLKSMPKDSIREQIREIFRNVCSSLFFSLLTAFHIGWRELNVGNWISRIQPREYTLSAKGRVRSVAGSQSLISAYLVVLWVFTYFGRPFEW